MAIHLKEREINTMPVRQQERRSQWDSIYMDGRLVYLLSIPIHFSFSHAFPCLYARICRASSFLDSFKVYARASKRLPIR